MDTPFAIATNVEKETGNNYRIDIEIIVPVTLEKFRLDLNELVDHPHQIGGFPPSGEGGNVVVTTRGLPRLKPGDKVPAVVQEEPLLWPLEAVEVFQSTAKTFSHSTYARLPLWNCN